MQRNFYNRTNVAAAAVVAVVAVVAVAVVVAAVAVVAAMGIDGDVVQHLLQMLRMVCRASLCLFTTVCCL